jgi:protein subunit release factor B
MTLLFSVDHWVGGMVLTPISKKKWDQLKHRMRLLGINETNIKEQFICGHGPGGQAVNTTHNVVRLTYQAFNIRANKSRYREDNRYVARALLCNKVATSLGLKIKEDEKINRRIKQKKRRKAKSNAKYLAPPTTCDIITK